MYICEQLKTKRSFKLLMLETNGLFSIGAKFCWYFAVLIVKAEAEAGFVALRRL